MDAAEITIARRAVLNFSAKSRKANFVVVAVACKIFKEKNPVALNQ
jgi:hypothetical protein